MIEYKPLNEDGSVQGDDANQMVVYKPRAELLLGYINKGPESERGVSMNKALKRYHRDRNAMGVGLTRAEEEKELWRSLRMKRNDRGEIVLFL
jgi:cell growth-regulating nucleolar protein